MPVSGYHLEEWRPVREIGKGAQGEATLMKRSSDGALVVEKLVKIYSIVDGLPMEAAILQDILPSNRRIIELMDFSFEPSSRRGELDLFEWFEYCRGGDLQHSVPQFERPSEDFIWHCFIQIAEALDVLHNAGSRVVVHRDVKPDNIFLMQKYHHEAPWPNLKLGDFGAAVFQELTEDWLVPCWQPPELPLCSTAGDIWGLGATVHWLVHRRPPIGPRPAHLEKKEWEKQPRARKPMPLPRSYSSTLNEYMMWCLECDPNKRISSHKLLERLRRDRPRVH